MLLALKTDGLGVLVIDRNLSEMAALIDRRLVPEKRMVVWSGTQPDLASNPAVPNRYLRT